MWIIEWFFFVIGLTFVINVLLDTMKLEAIPGDILHYFTIFGLNKRLLKNKKKCREKSTIIEGLNKELEDKNKEIEKIKNIYNMNLEGKNEGKNIETDEIKNSHNEELQEKNDEIEKEKHALYKELEEKNNKIEGLNDDMRALCRINHNEIDGLKEELKEKNIRIEILKQTLEEKIKETEEINEKIRNATLINQEKSQTVDDLNELLEGIKRKEEINAIVTQEHFREIRSLKNQLKQINNENTKKKLQKEEEIPLTSSLLSILSNWTPDIRKDFEIFNSGIQGVSKNLEDLIELNKDYIFHEGANFVVAIADKSSILLVNRANSLISHVFIEKGTINKLSVSMNEQFIIVGNENKFWVLSIESNRMIKKFVYQEKFSEIAFIFDNQYFIAKNDKGFTIWSLSNNKLVIYE